MNSSERRDVSSREQLDLLRAVLKELKELRIGIWQQSHADRISFNLREAAKLTGLGANTLYKYYKNGKLPGTQPAGPGGAILILRPDLLALIESGRDRVLKIDTKPKR